MTRRSSDTTLYIIPRTREEMTSAEFDAMMARGLAEAKADNSIPVAEAFAELRQRPHLSHEAEQAS